MNGYPVVLFFQSSFFPMEFKRSKSLPFGGYNEILTIKNLLEAGFAIIAPRAGAGLFWQSNLIPIRYDLSSDKFLVNKILSEIEKETHQWIEQAPSAVTSWFLDHLK